VAAERHPNSVGIRIDPGAHLPVASLLAAGAELAVLSWGRENGTYAPMRDALPQRLGSSLFIGLALGGPDVGVEPTPSAGAWKRCDLGNVAFGLRRRAVRRAWTAPAALASSKLGTLRGPAEA